MLDEQAGAHVVGRRREENSITVYSEAREVGGETIEKFDRCVVDEDKVPDQQWRCLKLLTNVGGISRKRKKRHIQAGGQKADKGVPSFF